MSITTRTLLLILMLTATSSAQQFRVNVQPQFRVIVQRPSAAVVDVSRTQHLETTPAADISELLIKRGEVINLEGESSEFTIVVCTAKWCGPCQTFKASSEYTRIRRRFPVEFADIDDRPEWRKFARKVPTIWIIRSSNRAMLRSFEGAVTLKQLETATEAIRNPQPVPVNNGVTQAELIQLHNRLHGGGQWTWPGNIREHLRSVHGVAL